ncbi:MAG TPA: hypothetical protein VMV65_09230 [Alphaproteobacteria bacterium]|nr:hypothetical protein [Alphaproteobacteria bacterium]
MFRNVTRKLVIVAGLVALCAGLAGAEAPRARFSNVLSYVGPPDLPVTLSMIEAGGGPSNFETTKLIGVLAGAQTSAEVKKLTGEYGAADVKSFLDVFNYVVSDALRLAAEAHVALPAQPNPSPTDGKALSEALYNMGVSPQGFDVEFMLDKLVSHPIHVQVMLDIDKKFGRYADANYHTVLQTAMTDLKSAYNF